MENEALKKLEEASPRLKECDLEKGLKIVQANDGSGMRRLPPKSLFGREKRNTRRNRGALGEGGTTWEMDATSLYDVVLFNSEECYE